MREGWRLIDIRLYVHIIFSDQILFSTFHISFFVDPYEQCKNFESVQSARLSTHELVRVYSCLTYNSLLVIGRGVQAVTIFEGIGLIPLSG